MGAHHNSRRKPQRIREVHGPEDHSHHPVQAEAGAGLRQPRYQSGPGGALWFSRCCKYDALPMFSQALQLKLVRKKQDKNISSVAFSLFNHCHEFSSL